MPRGGRKRIEDVCVFAFSRIIRILLHSTFVGGNAGIAQGAGAGNLIIIDGENV